MAKYYPDGGENFTMHGLVASGGNAFAQNSTLLLAKLLAGLPHRPLAQEDLFSRC